MTETKGAKPKKPSPIPNKTHQTKQRRRLEYEIHNGKIFLNGEFASLKGNLKTARRDT